MKFYIDITLLPDAEANLGFLWYKVFQQVHIALADNKIADNESEIALSFVKYGDKDFPLGNQLRLLASTEEKLQKLDIHRWLNRLSNYCHIKPIKSVPTNVAQHACFRRKAVKSIEKKAQRRSAYLGKPYEEVLTYLKQQGRHTKCKLPYINAESQKTKSRIEPGGADKFLIFIERVLVDTPIVGQFDCYGLSKTATVPCF